MCAGEFEGLTDEQVEQKVKEEEAKGRAVMLEMLGDLPDADIKPPDNVLFVCKLHEVTRGTMFDKPPLVFFNCNVWGDLRRGFGANIFSIR